MFFPCQKLVQVHMKDRLSGGRGNVNTFLTSESIASRTSIQTLTHAWMTNLALASGQGGANIPESLSPEAALFRSRLHAAKPLPASLLKLLMRRIPRASFSHANPLVSAETGFFWGRGLQYLVPIYKAKQDASNPRGSINGLGERGGHTPGCSTLDPIATTLWRRLGLEEHEVEQPNYEATLACAHCGKLCLSGDCSCDPPAGRAQAKKKRHAELNPSFLKACGYLACANIDVHVQWRDEVCAQEEDAAPAPPSPPRQDPEDELCKSVGPRRTDLSMLDLRRRPAEERPSSIRPRIAVERLSGCTVLSLGPSPLAKILCKQVELQFSRMGQGICWESRDLSRGYSLVLPAEWRSSGATTEAALTAIAADFSELSRLLLQLRESLSVRSLDKLSQYQGIEAAVEPGGTLHLQTSNTRIKELLMGAFECGATVQRVPRAFLIKGPVLPLEPLHNLSWSPADVCNEAELRRILQRNLEYVYLATTFSALAVAAEFHREQASALQAYFLLDAEKPDLCASDVYAEAPHGPVRLFHSDTVLGANPRARGWTEAERVPLKFLLHRARPDQYNGTAWQDLEVLEPLLEDAEVQLELDEKLTAFPPSLTLRDERNVYSVALRKGRKPPAAAVCSQGVFDGQADSADAQGQLLNRSRLYCIGCLDCTTVSEEEMTRSLSTALRDIEDIDVPAWRYFSRNDAGDARRLFEGKSLGSPVRNVSKEDLWAFRGYTDEDLRGQRPLSAEPLPEILEDIPGVAELLRGLSAASAEQRRAEKEFIACVYGLEAPAVTWVKRAAATATLLASAADTLAKESLMLRDL